ncbi:hypothetical protein [Arthrobacter globiformis]|uniref:hypothetical protein n=1 Tax=Arthrobacter globiformis TaxID=1665 RepID=UPI00277D988B|nr:hypothetical protein [Arthrobacter globiformis]MDQ0866505.1 hypothetical protein [Arthrobacter globiformis]
MYLYNDGSYPDGAGGLMIGTRFQLVAIMAGTLLRHSKLPLAVSTQPYAVLAQELNLGVAFNWTAIVETLAALKITYGIHGTPATPDPVVADTL